MCRLFGAISNSGIPEEVITQFIDLAENGKIGADFGCGNDKTRGHKDGWGVAALGDKKIYYREGIAATQSNQIHRVVKEIDSMEKVRMIMHLRRASDRNTISPENAHPFCLVHERREYYFAHNGSIVNYNPIIHGNIIDSEYLFRNLIAMIDGGLISSVENLRRKVDYTALNFLLLSENEIYAYRDAKKCVDYFTLYFATRENLHIICSEKLDLPGFKWKKMKNPSLLRLTEKGFGAMI
ncbi:MAG: class II glutamine amidotransferase [Thermoplasmata archaeon]